MLASGLYPGVVSHTRLKPRRHSLRYRIFMLLLEQRSCIVRSATGCKQELLGVLPWLGLPCHHPLCRCEGGKHEHISGCCWQWQQLWLLLRRLLRGEELHLALHGLAALPHELEDRLARTYRLVRLPVP